MPYWKCTQFRSPFFSQEVIDADTFVQTFNDKKWEKFNSEKVASLAYARIQGRNALVSHFQNSSLMNEEKWCRPILYHKDGPNARDQVPVIILLLFVTENL
jgi:hypothetical protein